ncbi:hypothetical protein [Niastella populi]|uniref:Uncharacterized protein n=1 Tax=Niastella populi TaxID=550983 RepID=A0A1V9FZA2_9BACT|nr:hypothetical protein [Niastella populi]OQP63608.1 hypothetical protein A4R26_16670 [Niastella populi]
MKKNWPYFVVASLLNTLLVTGAIIEFKLRGIAAPGWPVGNGLPAWNEINPFQLAGAMFVLSFLLIVTIAGIKNLVGGIAAKLHLFNEGLAGNQLAIGPPEA